MTKEQKESLRLILTSNDFTITRLLYGMSLPSEGNVSIRFEERPAITIQPNGECWSNQRVMENPLDL